MSGVRWGRFGLRGAGFVYVHARTVEGVRWTAKLVPTDASKGAAHAGWLLRIWQGTRLVIERGVDWPTPKLATAKASALVVLDELLAVHAQREARASAVAT